MRIICRVKGYSKEKIREYPLAFFIAFYFFTINVCHQKSYEKDACEDDFFR